MAARYQARPSRKGWQDQVHGRNVRPGINRLNMMTLIYCSYLHSLPIKEYQIVDFFLPKLKDEVMKVRHAFISRESPFEDLGHSTIDILG